MPSSDSASFGAYIQSTTSQSGRANLQIIVTLYCFVSCSTHIGGVATLSSFTNWHKTCLMHASVSRETRDNLDGYHQSVRETNDGFAFFLNSELAAECLVVKEDTKVSVIFYNRGCVLPIEAFQIGTNKLSTSRDGGRCQTKSSFIAGGHGIGLKDIISSAFSVLKMHELKAATHHPHQGFRCFFMNSEKIKVDRGMPGYKGVYSLDVKDCLPNSIPLACRKLQYPTHIGDTCQWFAWKDD